MPLVAQIQQNRKMNFYPPPTPQTMKQVSLGQHGECKLYSALEEITFAFEQLQIHNQKGASTNLSA